MFNIYSDIIIKYMNINGSIKQCYKLMPFFFLMRRLKRNVWYDKLVLVCAH